MDKYAVTRLKIFNPSTSAGPSRGRLAHLTFFRHLEHVRVDVAHLVVEEAHKRVVFRYAQLRDKRMYKELCGRWPIFKRLMSTSTLNDSA